MIKETLDFLRGSSVNIETMQRRRAWPLRKDGTHKSKSVNICQPHVDMIKETTIMFTIITTTIITTIVYYHYYYYYYYS